MQKEMIAMMYLTMLLKIEIAEYFKLKGDYKKMQLKKTSVWIHWIPQNSIYIQ